MSLRKKIDCMNRLFETLNCRVEILQYLREEKLMTDDAVQHLLHENHLQHAQKIVSILGELQQTDKLQLVDYEWTVLPKEIIRLTLVSRNNKKEFAYSI